MKRIQTILLLCLFCGAVWSCRKDDTYRHSRPVEAFGGTTYDYLKSQPENFRDVLFVLEKCGLANLLKTDSVTLFAPTDQSLHAAMESYNVYRKTLGLAPAGMDDVDSSSWRAVMGNYLFRGAYKMVDFTGQDGTQLLSLSLRHFNMRHTTRAAAGAPGLGAEVISMAYLNGSRFTKYWLASFAGTTNIVTKNGTVHILEPRHVLGFNTFVFKAREKQNLWSEMKVFADGARTQPNGTINLWNFYVKRLKAIDGQTVETEALTNGPTGDQMQITVNPDFSAVVKAAPSAANQTVEDMGSRFDPDNLAFNLKFRFMDAQGQEHKVEEILRYTAIREQ
ncbi:hypothetical protein [Chitinophaga caseinilytica]|uniref:Fasciclin domain-containing protein n=1 Tax=Chitinophaga caseinilytica TaxID=2267521 RepID=A0ABZ2ZAC5_9BACT